MYSKNRQKKSVVSDIWMVVNLEEGVEVEKGAWRKLLEYK